MAYYEYVEMNSLEPEEVIILENICMVVSGEWHYEEVEETKKMMKMFENSEEVLAKIMSIKEIDVSNRRTLDFSLLSEEEKRLGMIEEPEKWIAEKSIFEGMYEALAKFFLKIAVYQFCTVYWPKLACLDKINKEDIKTLQKELKHWEFCFWMRSHIIRGRQPDIISERELYKLDCTITWDHIRTRIDSLKAVWRWIKETYEECKDKIYYEKAKKLRLKYIEENGTAKRDDRSSKKIAEIESMRNLLDIIEKHLCDNLTPQNIADFKANMKDWEKDIEKLSALFNNLPALDLKTEVPLQAD